MADRDGSVTATYTVPMRANSGGLVRAGDTLYARAYHSQADPDAKTLDAQEVLLPVAIGGKQADEAAAEAGIVDAWTLLDGGVKVKSRLAGEATETKEMQIRRFVRYGADARSRPRRTRCSSARRRAIRPMWLLLPPRPLEVRGTPGSPVLFEAEGLVLRIDPKGRVAVDNPGRHASDRKPGRPRLDRSGVDGRRQVDCCGGHRFRSAYPRLWQGMRPLDCVPPPGHFALFAPSPSCC